MYENQQNHDDANSADGFGSRRRETSARKNRTQSNRYAKIRRKTPTTGGMRQRRNKHWQW